MWELLLKALKDELAECSVDIFAAELRITKAAADVEDAFHHFEGGDIKGSSAKVEDNDLLFFFDVFDAESQGSGGRFVDQMKDLESCELACGERGLTGSIWKVCRDRQDNFCNFLPCVDFCILAESAQQEGGEFFGSIRLFSECDGLSAAHESFDLACAASGFIEERGGFFADKHFLSLVDCEPRGDDGRFGERIRDGDGFLFLEDGDLRSGCTEIDSDG